MNNGNTSEDLNEKKKKKKYWNHIDQFSAKLCDSEIARPVSLPFKFRFISARDFIPPPARRVLFLQNTATNDVVPTFLSERDLTIDLSYSSIHHRHPGSLFDPKGGHQNVLDTLRSSRVRESLKALHSPRRPEPFIKQPREAPSVFDASSNFVFLPLRHSHRGPLLYQPATRAWTRHSRKYRTLADVSMFMENLCENARNISKQRIIQSGNF